MRCAFIPPSIAQRGAGIAERNAEPGKHMNPPISTARISDRHTHCVTRRYRHDLMTARPLSAAGPLQARVQEMSDEQLAEFTECVWELYRYVASNY